MYGLLYECATKPIIIMGIQSTKASSLTNKFKLKRLNKIMDRVERVLVDMDMV